MRQWIGIPPDTLCRQHLLGEHADLHGRCDDCRERYARDRAAPRAGRA